MLLAPMLFRMDAARNGGKGLVLKAVDFDIFHRRGCVFLGLAACYFEDIRREVAGQENSGE